MQWTRVLRRLGWVSAAVGLMLAAQMARAQGGCTFTDENGKTVFWPNCQPPTGTDTNTPAAPAGNKSAPPNGNPAQTPQAPAPGANPSQSFPYPGDTAGAPVVRPNAPAGQQGAGSSAGSPAGGNGGSSARQPAASRFPFPGEDSSRSGANGAGGSKPASSSSSGPLKDAGSSGSSSSSSSNDDDSSAGPLGDGDTDPAAKAAEARRAERLKKEHEGIVFHQTSDQREVEDLKIAAFYQSDGDFKGAYERATDAVSLAGDDAEAHLALAEAARRLGKLDEAETHYKKCLTLDPVPKVKRQAEKALKEMTSGG